MRTCAAILMLTLLSSQPVLALNNPASVNCEKLGGTLEIVTQREGGQIGLCRLPNGYIIEEWTLLRMLDAGLKVAD